MEVTRVSREYLPLYLFIALLTLFSACGLLGSNEDGGMLTVTPVSAVEVLLEVNAQPGADIAVTRDGTEIFSFTMEGADTLLIDTGLTPNTSYRWQAKRLSGRPHIATREVTTIDTTSHAFTWQKFEFGEYSSSSIKDVAIIDENNIWAVGEIYMNDSTGNPDFTPYNAVHWDGEEWEVKRIPYYYQEDAFYSAIRSIIAFNQDDIWFGIANMIHWDGSEYNAIDIPDNIFSSRINSMWGAEDNFYIVGNNGEMAHFNDDRWWKLESGTSLNINDIWGSRNPRTGKWEILAVASDVDLDNSSSILQVEGISVRIHSSDGLSWSLKTLWFEPGIRYIIGGDGIYQDYWLPKRWQRDTSFPGYYKNSIRGAAPNDIIVAGVFGLLMHYNGKEWHQYTELFSQERGFGRIAIKNDIVAVTGIEGNKGLVMIGRRE